MRRWSLLLLLGGCAAAPSPWPVLSSPYRGRQGDGTAYNPDLLKAQGAKPWLLPSRLDAGGRRGSMRYKKVRAASPPRRPRFLVCLAPSPTYVGRVFLCAFDLLASRSGKKMESRAWCVDSRQGNMPGDAG
jgi:hypothetical protein